MLFKQIFSIIINKLNQRDKQMNKLIVAILLTLATSISSANVIWYKGLYYGNICRTGAYYTIVPYQPVGAVCNNSYWGLWGTITDE